MRAFIINGATKNFADVIIGESTGGNCLVASFGFGVKQIERLISHFSEVVLIADASHSQLNSKVYEKAVSLSMCTDGFTFIPSKIHAKLAIINNDKLIFTSANLSANRRIESYLIGKVSEIEGVKQLKQSLGNPDLFFTDKSDDYSGIWSGVDLGGIVNG